MSHLDVAFLLGSPDISGGSNVIFEHAAGLMERGHRVAVVTERPFDRSALEWHPRARRLAFLDHEACRGHVFDVAVATWWLTIFHLPHVPARRLAYFVQSVETRFARTDEPEARALADFGYRLPLPVVTEAPWIADHLHRHYGRDTTIVVNGIQKDLFSPSGPAVDRERPHGLRVLVEGLLGIPRKKVDAGLQLCRQAGVHDVWLLTPTPLESHPLATRVFSRIPITDVPAVYRSCDVLMKLSTVEGMFGPPLEMMHCGGTCITSNVEGHEMYVRDAENALVVPIGEEPRVVDALRRLASDAALLDRLKRGALATAATWPAWDTCVDGMEAFLRDVAASPDDPARMRAELMGVIRAAQFLGGPLMAARAQDRASWYLEQPARSLLRVGERLTRETLRRATARIRRSVPPPSAAPSPPAIAPLPPAVRPAVTLGAGPPRLCFVGDPRRHLAHVPRSGDACVATFVDAGGLAGESSLEAIRRFAPDWTIVFTPELLTAPTRQAIAGPVAGVVTSTLTPDAERALATTFPRAAVEAGATLLVHPDEREVGRLLEAGVNAATAFLPPVDEAFADGADLAAWWERRIPVLVVLEAPIRRMRAYEAIRRAVHVEEVATPPAETMLAPLLHETRIVLHLGRDEQTPLAAAKVMRDALAGCLVVAPLLDVDHRLMAGEHYLGFQADDELMRLVQTALLTPERFDVVRRVGRDFAAGFARPSRWVDLVARLGAPEHLACSSAAAS